MWRIQRQEGSGMWIVCSTVFCNNNCWVGRNEAIYLASRLNRRNGQFRFRLQHQSK